MAPSDLQFDVAAYRLKDEYSVEAVVEPVSVHTARWVVCKDDKIRERFQDKAYENLALDGDNQLVYLAPTRVNLSLSRNAGRISDSWRPANFNRGAASR